MATAKWLTDSEMRAWRGFIRRSADLVDIITKDLEPFGLDGGDYQLLAMLSESPGRKMKMCDLAETLGLSRSGLTRRMEGVLKAKYVSRVSDAAVKEPFVQPCNDETTSMSISLSTTRVRLQPEFLYQS